MLDTMYALTIASFIGMSTRSLPYARSAASVDTRRPRKLLKTVWYFPITPRLQRYFADPKQAKLMRWHVERKQQKEEAEKRRSMGIREELHANHPNDDDDDDDDDDEPPEDTESRRKGKKAKKQSENYFPPACFTLSQKEIGRASCRERV